MRIFLSLLIISLGCGRDGSSSSDAGSDVEDASGSIDAPPLVPNCSVTNGTDLRLAEVATGLVAPVFLTHAGDERLFIVEQPGIIRIVENGAVLETPFLDISQLNGGPVEFNGEMGLLGLAFHPNYRNNGRFFVNYTTRSPNGNGGTQIETIVAEYSVSSGDPGLADPASEQVLQRVFQPFTNHNGGMTAFGPDGMLYTGLGDGGSGFDPDGHGQNTMNRLGSMLRLDVATSGTAAIPSDNPFVGMAGFREEIWSYGWRNPWRWSFDRQTGDIWVGDVGQGCIEEVSVQPAGVGGLNFGWVTMEGSQCTPPNNQCVFPTDCQTTGLTMPYYEYTRQGIRGSITGGYVYRGTCLPDIDGWYFYAEYELNEVFRIDTGVSPAVAVELPFNEVDGPASFGEDVFGELYVLSAESGTVHRIEAASTAR